MLHIWRKCIRVGIDLLEWAKKVLEMCLSAPEESILGLWTFSSDSGMSFAFLNCHNIVSDVNKIISWDNLKISGNLLIWRYFKLSQEIILLTSQTILWQFRNAKGIPESELEVQRPRVLPSGANKPTSSSKTFFAHSKGSIPTLMHFRHMYGKYQGGGMGVCTLSTAPILTDCGKETWPSQAHTTVGCSHYCPLGLELAKGQSRISIELRRKILL